MPTSGKPPLKVLGYLFFFVLLSFFYKPEILSRYRC